MRYGVEGSWWGEGEAEARAHMTIPRAQEPRFVSKITITFNLISWTKSGGTASFHNALLNSA